MAKKRTSSALRVVSIPRPAAPVIRVSAPRAVSRKAPKRSRRRASGSHGNDNARLLALGVGAAAFGFIEKNFTSLPTIPAIGRKGTLTGLAYLVARNTRSSLAWDITKAGIVLCGYQFGNEGRISGEDDYE